MLRILKGNLHEVFLDFLKILARPLSDDDVHVTLLQSDRSWNLDHGVFSFDLGGEKPQSEGT